MVKTKQKVKPKENKMSLTLCCGDQKYSTKAETFDEAMEVLRKDSLGKLRTWVIIKLKVGKKQSEYRYSPIQVKRAFAGGFARKLLLARLETLLK